MIYECVECDIIIAKGKPWVLGKDYLFCSDHCRTNFLMNNPNIETNIKIPDHIPESTHPYYCSVTPIIIIIPSQISSKQLSPPCSPPSFPRAYISSLIDYTWCNLLSTKYIFSSIKELISQI